jgi:membrane associated rhomboid family serine protease
MFPVADENQPGRGPAIVTLAFIAINLAVFFLLQAPEDPNEANFTYGYSAIPFEITENVDLVEPEVVPIEGEDVVIPQAPGPDPIQLTLLTSMFMHGGFGHIFGNMLFLWIFGDNIEHALGRILYIGFYLVAGIVASLAQIAINPDSVIPTLGASGAISGVLGAYLVMFPRNRVTVIIFRFIPYQVPAIVAVGMWAILQFINGFGSIVTSEETTGGVAYLAHIGGFIVGVIAGFLFRGRAAGSSPTPRQSVVAWR